MKIEDYAGDMFTRIPTFIPTSSEHTEIAVPRNTKVKTSYGATITPSITTQEVPPRRRKRAKTLKKRLPTKRSEDNHHVRNEHSFVNADVNAFDDPAQQTLGRVNYLGDESKIIKRTSSRSISPGFLSPNVIEEKKKLENRLGKDDSRSTEHLERQSPRNDTTRTDKEMINSEDLTFSLDTEMLTLPKLHKRNRRKFVEDTPPQDIQTKRHAKNEISNVMNNINMTAKRESTINRLNRRQVEGTTKFRSKIPVRFPYIQENTRYGSSKLKQVPANPSSSSLPPIYSANCNKTAVYSGKVTQSILDYENMIEKDFKRLGENLQNTFKLLHQYIDCSGQVNGDNS